jgi:hypothetical protein
MRRVSSMKWASRWTAIHVVAPRFVTTAASKAPPFTRSKPAPGRSLIYPTGGANQPVATTAELTTMKAELTTMKAELATMKAVAFKMGYVPMGYKKFAQSLLMVKPEDLTADIRNKEDDIRKIWDDIRKKEDDIRRAQDSPSAIAIIEAAKPSEGAAEGWLLSYPKIQPGKLPAPANLFALRNSFRKGEDDVRTTLNSRDKDGSLIVALEAGMGIGKSYTIDIANKLLFHESNPIVLKVTYNRQQNLSAERASEDAAAAGFIARLMLFVRNVGVTDMAGIVKEALLADPQGRELNPKAFVKWFLKHDSRRRKNPKARPVIIAVDELGMLSKGSQSQNSNDDPPVQGVLSVIAAIILEFKKHSTRPRSAIGLVTALPHLGLQSLSGRTVFPLDAVAFTQCEAKEFLLKNCRWTGSNRKRVESVVSEMLLYCGVHPRSLAVAAQLYNTAAHQVPTPAAVARGCKWKNKQGPKEDDIRDAISESYSSGSKSLGPKQERLWERAALMIGPTGDWMIPPTFFWSTVNDSQIQDVERSLYHIRKMFQFDTSDVPTKALETINYHWDCFRGVNHMPLIPPSMEVRPDSAEVEVKRLLLPKRFSLSQRKILGKGRKCLIRKIDRNTYYRPKAQNHRAIESMFVAKGPDSIPYLCLFQSKINSSLTGAIKSLNEAAEDLGRVWKGKFLLIVYALEARSAKLDSAGLPAGHHPVVVVDRDNIDTYFTPTIGTAVRLQVTRHGRARAT